MDAPISKWSNLRICAREIGSSRKVLSQQAVGVLVAAALPWTARITQINLHVGGNREVPGTPHQT
jgi:hypothetical protein